MDIIERLKDQKVKRSIFIWAVFTPLALNAIPFTQEILAPVLDFDVAGGIQFKMILAIAAFFGMWFIYKRDL